MPPSLSRQILYHDPSKYYDFRFDPVEDAVVGEIETVCYVA